MKRRAMVAVLSRHAARGVVLPTTALLLLVITVLALGAISLNSTQTKIAANTADAQLAFQIAEGTLNKVQRDVIAGNYQPAGFTAGNPGLYIFDPSVAPLWTSVDWSGSAVLQGFQGAAGPAATFFIEMLPSFIAPGANFKQPTQVFRITTRAVGPSGGSPVILQSTVQIQGGFKYQVQHWVNELNRVEAVTVECVQYKQPEEFEIPGSGAGGY